MRAIIHSGRDVREGATGLQVKDVNKKDMLEISQSFQIFVPFLLLTTKSSKFGQSTSKGQKNRKEGQERGQKEVQLVSLLTLKPEPLWFCAMKLFLGVSCWCRVIYT